MSNGTDSIGSYFDVENPAFEVSYHENGQAYWYASDFIHWLGYKEYTPTMTPINKAMTVCISLPAIITADHFREEVRYLDGKQIKDFKLSRFACYLVSMNADVKKAQVAKAQAYFAAFTASVQEYVKSQEDIERVPLRKDVTESENALSSTAKQAGVIRYDYFKNKGYMGLYNMPINKIKELKGIPENDTPLDYMGAEELGANIFRLTQTNAKIKRDNIRGQESLERTAFQVGQTVRKAIQETGGTMPENLPPEVHVKRIKSDLKKTSKELGKVDKKLIEQKNREAGRPKKEEAGDGDLPEKGDVNNE
jgi:DNA-damage-inducible protein D